MIKNTRIFKIGIIAATILLAIGIGSAFLVNQTISANNLEEENRLVTSMVEEADKDQSLMNQEQVNVLEQIKKQQNINYKNKDLEGLLNTKEKLQEFMDDYPDVIVTSLMTSLSAMDLPAGANQKEKDKLSAIRNEVEKGIMDSSLTLVTRVELINAGVKQVDDLILVVTNRIKEESKRVASVNNPPKIVYKKPVIINNTLAASAQLNVGVINQRPELPSGCEATSFAMLLNYIGVPITKIQIVEEMPYHSSNPDLGFVGSPYSSSGYTIYPPALMSMMGKYAGSAVNLTGKGTDSIKNSIDSGKPVIVWGKFTGFYLHCVLVTGYSKDGFYYNDPWTGVKNKYISNSSFEIAWKAIGYRAMSY